MGHDAVAAGRLGLVERLVGGLDDLFRLALLGAALGHADADGDRHEAAGRALAPLLTSTGRVLRTVLLIAQGHLVEPSGGRGPWTSEAGRGAAEIGRAHV